MVREHRVSLIYLLYDIIYIHRKSQVYWTEDIQTNPQNVKRDKNCISWNEKLVYNQLRWASAHVSNLLFFVFVFYFLFFVFFLFVVCLFVCFCGGIEVQYYLFARFFRDGSDALGHEGKDMGNIVLKLRNVAQGVGVFPSLSFFVMFSHFVNS
jgi:hypothetical protein